MYDLYDPLNDMCFYNMGNNVEQDPDEAAKGCLIKGLTLIGFTALVIIAYFISKII